MSRYICRQGMLEFGKNGHIGGYITNLLMTFGHEFFVFGFFFLFKILLVYMNVGNFKECVFWGRYRSFTKWSIVLFCQNVVIVMDCIIYDTSK